VVKVRSERSAAGRGRSRVACPGPARQRVWVAHLRSKHSDAEPVVEGEIVPAEQVPAETKPVAQSWRGPQDGPPSWLRPVPPVDSKDRPPATPVIAKSGAESEAQRQRVAADRSVEFRIMNERPVFRGMPEPSLGNEPWRPHTWRYE
jgi:hypothetical protein